MGKVDLSISAQIYSALDVPEECTVGRWKQLLSQGFLGDKILYATKLTCREVEKGRTLEDAALLPTPPSKMYIEGPGSVVNMLQLALKKKFGAVIPVQRPPPPRTTPHLERKYPLLASGASPSLSSRAPIPLKSNGGGEQLRFFCSGLQGLRPHMEDRTCGHLQLPGHEHAALFAVFDGHGGHEVAELAVELLPGILAAALSENGDPAEALKRAFQELDEEIYRPSQQRAQAFERVGSTAVVTLLLHEAGQLRLLCANCGDSRAVLCRQGHAMDLSVDQKPQNPEERRRIEAAGGRVELFGPCWRIDAGLNLSRALGDFGYKANPGKSPAEQKVIAVPEIKETIIDKDDQFVVMGSDGVFDVLTSEALVLHLRSAQQRGRTWPEAIESALATSLSGGDNVSLCLVEFLHAT
mmetsp:Transcript_123489/g.360626  ORF Transcript_123489/g.360626 Transcript_123489/m.360626 type:complete len:411 (+) Transcript_123489:138-1370(+)